ncbi:alpha/beta hydrolase [Streptomyces sp. NPDC008222]|uniref:alpha/beta hydrolase n=1 Tax=Streptomyces sp. NPDC008222 TaxID=3364820 RepID=UPI0036E28522
MNRTPLIFIHGLWLHATSWQPWVEHFTRQGFAPLAPGWPGEPATVEEARRHPEAVAELGLDDITDHFTRIVRSLNDAPVIIGHDLGGLIAQKLIGVNLARAAVAIAPAQIKGVPLPQSYTQRCSKFPLLSNPTNVSRTVPISAEQFRYAFANGVTPEESATLFQGHTVPSPGRPFFELTSAEGGGDTRTAVETRNGSRGPLLLISGQEDRLVPDFLTRAAYKLYGDSTAVTELKQFADRAHCLTIDSGWRTIAAYTSTWLSRHGIPSAGLGDS